MERKMRKEDEVKDGQVVNRDLKKIMGQFMPKVPEISFTLVKNKENQYVGVKADLNFRICENRQIWAKDKEKIKSRFTNSDLYVLRHSKISGDLERVVDFEIRMDKSFLWNFSKNNMMLNRYINRIIFESNAIIVYVGLVDIEFTWQRIILEIQHSLKKMLELGFSQEMGFLHCDCNDGFLRKQAV